MQLTCPNCGATYEIPEDAIGANGRKIRCRACDTSWFEPASGGAVAPPPVAPLPATVPPPEAPEVGENAHNSERAAPARRRGPWLLLALVVLVVALGAVAAAMLMGPQQIASRLGIGEHRVPLGIAITREPDWRMIAGGSQLFAVSGRIWNPTKIDQAVPDIRAELKNPQGQTVYSWTITRPVAHLAPGAAVNFDGAAVDVPANSSNVSVSFAGAGQER
jgi:predicted Zn finger-like uncharacterized protein